MRSAKSDRLLQRLIFATGVWSSSQSRAAHFGSGMDSNDTGQLRSNVG